jgi:4'-phosphopantetheinyl transferase EntD
MLDLEHGRCVIVSGDDARAAGREAMRMLLGDPAAPLPSDDRGAPVLPAGWVGSISHKGTRAAALVAPDEGARIGLDLERAAPPRLDIGSRILTPAERAALAQLPPHAYGLAVTLRFAIKEAIYKAVDPFVRRYVGFTEVELEVRDDGSCAVRVLDPARLPVVVSATWREVDGHWLTTARARRVSTHG